MGGHIQSSRDSGGYVGGLLQLFDWNAKSRKKLFSNKSDNPDQSKQKKRTDGNLPVTRYNPVEMDVDDYVKASTFHGSSDYRCASSTTNEEGYGSKAPSVVARLMGLDTMPTSNLADPFSTPFSDSKSLRESTYVSKKLKSSPENHHMSYGNFRCKVDAPIQKTIKRPIEKFQSEILPSKSAKKIPITHQKLLSPIKGPGFISSKNAAHIMKAAAKIIEPGPEAPSKTKMPSVATTSVPLKVREIKEKAEASQKISRRPVESNAAKLLKGQPMSKRWNGSSDSQDYMSVTNKEKSISLALQGKVNVQKREYAKEPSKVVLSQPFRSKSSSQKSMPIKSSTQTNSGALKQNNQKQNCTIEKDFSNLNASLSKSQSRLKHLSGDSSSGRQKSSSKYGENSKVGSRKLSLEANGSKEEVLYSSTRNVPRKRRSLDGNFGKEKSQVVDSMLVDSNEKPIQSDLVVDKPFTRSAESKRKGTDVVSFTFTSPLSRQNNIFGSDYRTEKATLSSASRNSGKLSLVECNVIGSDNLGLLLEQKLRDFTHGTDSSRRYREGLSGSSASICQDIAPTPKEDESITMAHKNKNQDVACMISSSEKEGSYLFSSGGNGLMTKYNLQGTMEVEDCRSDDTETRKSLHYRLPSPISVLDSTFMTESWNSSDTVHSIIKDGSKHGSSVQALEVLDMNSCRKSDWMELDTELTDSASSSSIRTLVNGKQMAVPMTTNMGLKWEFQYVREILFNVEFMFMDFARGRDCKIINPHLFNQLENRKEVLKESIEEDKLERKVLFDCVSECKDVRCSRYSNLGFKTWEKGLSTVRRKERLTEDVYKEILSWKVMEDSLADDLVDKDLSNQYGRWLDFEVEAFEVGVEIGSWLLNCLITEVVIDLAIMIA